MYYVATLIVCVLLAGLALYLLHRRRHRIDALNAQQAADARRRAGEALPSGYGTDIGPGGAGKLPALAEEHHEGAGPAAAAEAEASAAAEAVAGTPPPAAAEPAPPSAEEAPAGAPPSGQIAPEFPPAAEAVAAMPPVEETAAEPPPLEEVLAEILAGEAIPAAAPQPAAHERPPELPPQEALLAEPPIATFAGGRAPIVEVAAGTLRRGRPFPLGATFDGAGVNFALFSLHAQAVTLCLFDAGGENETLRLPLTAGPAGVWHGYLPEARPGLVYGYRVAGPYDPARRHRFNPAKLLLDPYARAVVGEFRDDPVHHDYQARTPDLPDQRDNTAYALKARVIDEPFDWEDDTAPAVPWPRTVIYEGHVKGLTKLHPQIPEALRGTYAGVGHPAMIAHLRQLGVTALELLPIQHFIDEQHLQKTGLRNYWGYNPIACFAPEPRYWSGREGTTPLSEVREMVKALHAAGIEVILDVVFNHTGEGGASGATLSLRGIDNAVYYAFQPSGEYENWSGCGNALNVAHPRVVQLIMDCLRYWVSECHIDGFRFDLAATLGRDGETFSPDGSLFTAMMQDPLIGRCKLIAEPWDIGPNGYQVGNFPAGCAEWNDKFRDTVRGFWLRDCLTRSVFVRRFAGSSDCFQKPGREPATSVNYLTAHDGFTLTDLTSYNTKHNLANGEDNRDGTNNNQSWNCGEEGPSLDANVNLLRRHVRKAMLATLLLAQGTPMLLAGDELGHTQQGNNNAYCQDNPLSWLDWSAADHDMTAFVGKLVEIRREIAALTNGTWWTGNPDAAGVADVCWLNPSGSVLTLLDWDDSAAKALMIRFSDGWLLLVNSSAHQVRFNMPPGDWLLRLSSADDMLPPGDSFIASGRSVAVLAKGSAK